jgi:glycogen debranching enzyme
MLDADRERSIVAVCHRHLYTAYGIRSLSESDADFKPTYQGKVFTRDLAYHMGTVWAFPFGAYADAYLKTHADADGAPTAEAVAAVKQMCLLFDDHMHDGCLGGIAEVFDGLHPCTGRGCYTQAWSVAEVLRVWSKCHC